MKAEFCTNPTTFRKHKINMPYIDMKFAMYPEEKISKNISTSFTFKDIK